MLTLGAVPPPPAAHGSRPTLDEITALLQGANEYHLAGRVRDAEVLLEQALQLAPELPEVLQPAGWPGHEARRLCKEVYRRLLQPSERHLDRHLLLASGEVPPASRMVDERFSSDDPLAEPA